MIGWFGLLSRIHCADFFRHPAIGASVMVCAGRPAGDCLNFVRPSDFLYRAPLPECFLTDLWHVVRIAVHGCRKASDVKACRRHVEVLVGGR